MDDPGVPARPAPAPKRPRSLGRIALVAAEAKVEVAEANCRSEITTCAERESSCQEDLQALRRGMGQMVAAPPAPPASGPL